jgi:hypothetical protein
MSGNSGRGGRERQGQHQRVSQQHDDYELNSEDEEAQGELRPIALPAAAAAAAAVYRPIPNSYLRWSKEKVLMVLQTIVDAPSRMSQTNKFESSNNADGQPKTNLSRMECVFFCVFLVIACLFFCSYGDWKLVYNDTAEFLSASPSFLALNKNKVIQVSTIKNKVAEWSAQVDEQRRGWNPSPVEYDDCTIHAQWIIFVIKLQKSEKASKAIFFI